MFLGPPHETEARDVVILVHHIFLTYMEYVVKMQCTKITTSRTPIPCGVPPQPASSRYPIMDAGSPPTLEGRERPSVVMPHLMRHPGVLSLKDRPIPDPSGRAGNHSGPSTDISGSIFLINNCSGCSGPWHLEGVLGLPMWEDWRPAAY